MKKKHRILVWSASASLSLFISAIGFGLWSASDQLLSPSFKGMTKDFSVCAEEAEQHLGKGCGNLRLTRQFAFTEVPIPSSSGNGALPGWLVRSEDNGAGPAQGAIMLVHPGGTDRRYMTHYIRIFLDRKLDVLTFDYSCHGEASCAEFGLSYGERESKDVFSAYQYLRGKYGIVYAMGSSVGASSILIALPRMPELAGVIAENPFASFERLIREAPEAQSMPTFFVKILIGLAEFRGGFDGRKNPANSLPHAGSEVPLFFIHSRADKVVSHKQTEDLVNLYAGSKIAWYPEEGEHAGVWEANRAEYEKRAADFLGGRGASRSRL